MDNSIYDTGALEKGSIPVGTRMGQMALPPEKRTLGPIPIPYATLIPSGFGRSECEWQNSRATTRQQKSFMILAYGESLRRTLEAFSMNEKVRFGRSFCSLSYWSGVEGEGSQWGILAAHVTDKYRYPEHTKNPHK